jgi:hypothetical protein
MIMNVVVDAVAPGISPAVAFEQLLEHGYQVEGLRQADRALVDDKRPFRMIRNEAIVLEAESPRFAVSQERIGIVRAFPAGGPFGVVAISQYCQWGRFSGPGCVFFSTLEYFRRLCGTLVGRLGCHKVPQSARLAACRSVTCKTNLRMPEYVRHV